MVKILNSGLIVSAALVIGTVGVVGVAGAVHEPATQEQISALGDDELNNQQSDNTNVEDSDKEIADVTEQKASEPVGTSDVSTQNFADRIAIFTQVLSSEKEYAADANKFTNNFEAATVRFEEALVKADEIANASTATTDEAQNQYIDAFNNAKANYFNELDVAKNDLAASLSNKGHEANVAKDQFMNRFNSSRDAYGQALEQAKNDLIVDNS